MQGPNSLSTTNRLLIVIVIFLTGAALKLAAPVVIALLLTLLLVYLIDPLVVFLHRRRLPLWLSALIAIIFFAAIFAGFGVLIFFDLPHFAHAFPRFQEAILERAQGIMDKLQSSLGITLVVDPFEELRKVPIRPLLMGVVRLEPEDSFRVHADLLLCHHPPDREVPVIRMVLTVFPRRHSMVPIMLKHIDRHMRAFLGIKALASLVIGVGTALILLAFRVEFAVTWGFLTILLNFIPALGPITSIVLPSLITIIQYPGFIMPFSVVLCLSVLHSGISNFIEPRFLGERLDLSFFVIFLSLFFWGWMWGPAGVLLAVPVTASLKIVLERIPATSRVALLLGKANRRRNFNPRP